MICLREQQIVRLRLDNETLKYIEDYAEQNEYSYKNAAIKQIIKEHKELSKMNWNLHYIAETVTEKVNEQMKNTVQDLVVKEMTRIRLGTNNADRNTQILIELIQGHMELSNVKAIMTTDVYKPDFLEHAEKVVHERITNLKQRKDSKTQEKGELQR